MDFVNTMHISKQVEEIMLPYYLKITRWSTSKKLFGPGFAFMYSKWIPQNGEPMLLTICDWACKNRPSEHKKFTNFFSFLLYHNLITIYTTTTKSSSLLQNIIGYLLQLTELGYYLLNERY